MGEGEAPGNRLDAFKAAGSFEYVFEATGRPVLLRRRLPLFALVREGKLTNDLLEDVETLRDGGKLEDAAQAVQLMDTLVAAMILDPPVWAGAVDELPDGHVLVGDLDDVEIEEVLGLAFASIRDAATFRGDDDGARAGEGGGDVPAGAEAEHGRGVPAG